MVDENKVTIKVNDNGSLRVSGSVELVDAEGNPFEHKESFSVAQQTNKGLIYPACFPRGSNSPWYTGVAVVRLTVGLMAR
jgi:hypothetical protein